MDALRQNKQHKMMKITPIQESANIFSLRSMLLLGFVVILSCGIIGYVVILKGCLFLNCVEERSFNVLDLDLPTELFPDEATVTPINRPSESRGAFESASMSFYWQGGNKRAGYRVWRFRTEEEASRAFLAESGGSRYRENELFFHQSSIADEFAVGCGQLQSFGYRCNMAARYQEYTINLIASIDDEMSIEMFDEVVIFIDREMEHRLYGQEQE